MLVPAADDDGMLKRGRLGLDCGGCEEEATRRKLLYVTRDIRKTGMIERCDQGWAEEEKDGAVMVGTEVDLVREGDDGPVIILVGALGAEKIEPGRLIVTQILVGKARDGIKAEEGKQ